jgi:hypothetical protein
VDLQAIVDLGVEPARVYREVADLSTYPEWLGIVLEAEADGEGAWYVELGARLGSVRGRPEVGQIPGRSPDRGWRLGDNARHR